MQEKVIDIKLPDKIYFRIGEVSEYTDIKPYVLRYWESEFGEIEPIRRKSQRLYDRDTIYTIIKIKNMLYEQNYTIAGAKKKLKEFRNQPANRCTADAIWSTSCSAKGFPIICMLLYFFSNFSTGRERPGNPAKFTHTV